MSVTSVICSAAGALALAACLAAQTSADDSGTGALKRWSAADLAAGGDRVLLRTQTHLFKAVHVDGNVAPQSHEGTSDIFFVESGGGTITVGEHLEGAKPVPGMPGELRDGSLQGSRVYSLQPRAMIDLPPSTPYTLHSDPGGMTLLQLRINAAMHPWAIVQTQQSTLPVTAAYGRATVPTSVGLGAVTYWSAEALQKAHETLSARAEAGASVADPRDLVQIPITRTHAYNFMHRVMGKNGPPGVEFHEGTTDIYFVIGGSATLMTGGEIENRELIPGRPGEYRGTSIRNGDGFRLGAGDVFNMPPSIPHQSLPEPGGYTYLLIKVNTGIYPWSLIE